MPSHFRKPRHTFSRSVATALAAVVATVLCVGGGAAGAQMRFGGAFAMHPGMMHPGMMPRPVFHGAPGHGIGPPAGGHYGDHYGVAAVATSGHSGRRHRPGEPGEGPPRHRPPRGGVGLHHPPGEGGGRHDPPVGVHHQIGGPGAVPTSYATSSGSSGQPAGNGFDNRRGGPPPRGERRFVPDEVITEFSANASPQAIVRLARRFDLTRLDSQRFALIGATLYRWRIGGRRSVASVVRALGHQNVIASVQPNYLFALQEQPASRAAARASDSAQYVLAKLDIGQAHQIATGKGIAVAVIDSAIDLAHPDLGGTVINTFDALGGAGKPQQHGTAMAGAIAAHGKLIGIAPGAQVLAARAFDDSRGIAEGTSFAIYKALQWAADKGARVINMSFVGPPDPTMHRMLTAAYAKGMVLVAAAGNAGPNSEPLYPAAEPDVIAVTATDGQNALFKSANRGAYVAVAAPGVDILALAPGDSYQITTGTSVAAAHVSGLAALLLQRDPSLNPKGVRDILMATAKPLTAAGQHSESGVGLVNAYEALSSVNTTSAKR